MRLAVVLFVFVIAWPLAAQEEKLPPKVKQEADKILKWGEDRTLLDTVREQNKSGLSMEQIMKTDHEWTQGTLAQEFVNGILSNACAVRLKELQKEIPSALESFVMDSQGALVCASHKTTDYYQGDEPKWTNAYLDGKGAVFIGKRQYDESTKSTLLHISAPLMDKGKAIGVVAVGINLTKLAEE